MDIRRRLEEQEKRNFSPFAVLSTSSQGRLRPESECGVRLIFQHDRDRIIHSKSFRRLKHKTQVFLAPSGDHYRTRLTHTLEVSQIARTIARALRLNEDLCEAIALGHDLGHTPFGHAGEEILNEIHPGGFKHAEQSLRVVDVLEKDGRGLNLTWEVRDGILKHTKGGGDLFPQNREEKALSLEGQIVRIADRIAYVNHDIDDALRGNVIVISELPEESIKVLGTTHAKRINTMVCDIIFQSSENLPELKMSRTVLSATDKLRDFLYERVYFNPATHTEFVKAKKILSELYQYFLEHSENLPDTKAENVTDARRVCDFIAGMTDRYAIETYERLFIPQPWLVM
ncbi:MAG: deoxyguanosinetriphosphate triphosphohydrolase [Candidatus Schekmanbacteria bacterium]|nr:deoxyguanosinetriphosphate triphosphohydrolase [Candidatus Schekmanbacteria bacterium]